MSYNVSLNEKDGIVEAAFEGVLDAALFQQSMEESLANSEKLARSGRTSRTLVDLSKVTEIKADAVTLIIRISKLNTEGFVALVGESEENKKFSAEVIKATDAQDRMKQFDTREEALAWLLSK